MIKKLLFLTYLLLLLNSVFSQNDTTRVNALNSRAWKIRSADLDSSLLLSNQALVLLNGSFKNQHFENNWYEKALVRTYYYLGFFYNLKGGLTVPMEYFNKALKISNEINYLYGQSVAIGGMGSFYMRQGNNPKALEYFFKALKIDEKRGHQEGIQVRLSNIGNIYQSLGNYPKSLEYFSKALALAEKFNDKKHISIQLGNLGIVYYEQHNFPKAIEYYLKALAIDREINNKNGIAINLNNIASLYKDEKDYNKAYDYFSQALVIAQEQGDLEIVASTLGNLGILYTLEKNYSKAEDCFLKTLKIADEMQALDITSDFEMELSKLYTAWGKDKLALIHYKKYAAAKDSVFNALNTEKNVRTEMNYEFDKKEATAKAQHEKEIIAFEAENKIQKQMHLFLLVVIALILITLFFVKRAYDNKKRVAVFLASESQRKEVLLQEVHHRINNNLQIISSLLSLQANSAQDPRLYEYLQQSQNRIQSLSVLHELLYQTDSPLEINMQEYLNKVLDFHRDVLQTRAFDISINTEIAAVTFPTKAAVPIALIVNELVTNSVKYAFNAESHGSISVSLLPAEQKGNAWTLNVRDNGKGLPAETAMRKDSLGLRLVKIMTKQMNGTLTTAAAPGASFTLSFSLTT
jgi:two-component sensor histidine kinase/tetratricopeptide (TPR) repeat protein